MAPYSEQVLLGGYLQVWSTEWEVVWANDHPRTRDGSWDMRYAYSGTKFTRDRIVALTEGLEHAWRAAVEAARTLGTSSGNFRKPATVWPATIEISNGQPRLVVKDICWLENEQEVLEVTHGLRELIAHGDAKQGEVQRLYNP